jgi:hypothetical protein
VTDIPGTSLFSDRDWKREARLAADNFALIRVLEEYRAARMAAMIEAPTLEERERARIEYLAAEAIGQDLEALAGEPD